MKLIVEAPACYVCVIQEYLEILFGEGCGLTRGKDLSQPSRYAYKERVTAVGSKKEMPGVSILRSVRKDTQVELSLTNVRSISVNAPVRESGDITGSGSCRLVSLCGKVELTEGVIAAKCHIHATPEDVAELDAADKDIISAKIDTSERNLVFDDIVICVSPSYVLAVHIDTDEFNAVSCGREVSGETVKQGIEEESKIKEK